MPARYYEAEIVLRFVLEFMHQHVRQRITAAFHEAATSHAGLEVLNKSVLNELERSSRDLGVALLHQTPWDSRLGDSMMAAGGRGILLEFKGSWSLRSTERKDKPSRERFIAALNVSLPHRLRNADRCHWFVYGPEANDAGGAETRQVPGSLAGTDCIPYRKLWTETADALVEHPDSPISAVSMITRFLARDPEVGVEMKGFKRHLDDMLKEPNDGGSGSGLAILLTPGGELSLSLRNPVIRESPGRAAAQDQPTRESGASSEKIDRPAPKASTPKR